MTFPRIFIEIFPALYELIFGLFESIEEGLLILISTFDVLVRGDVFLKFPCYFVASSWNEDGLLDARFEFNEFVA